MNGTPIYVVDGLRTPFLKARGGPGPFTAADLAVQAGRQLLLRQPFAPEDLSEVILGCASPAPEEMNIGRILALRLGCGEKVPGWTVMRNCASGMQAIDSAMSNIQRGRAELVLAGGSDALSHAPLLFSAAMVRWLVDWKSARGLGRKLALLGRLRPAHLAPVLGLLKGLTDPVVGLTMGQTAENLAWEFDIGREEMDAYSVRSHQRALAAREQVARELAPLLDAAGCAYEADDGLRPDASPKRLAKLKPVFDRRYGSITAGNSSQVTDGAALVLLASAATVERWKLQPLGRILDCQWAGLDPARMGLGPVHAATPILQRQGLGLNDLDAWEINEAFAAQVLACLAAWRSDDFCRTHLGLPGALGDLDQEKLNRHGGAIALGHPVGASGARIVLHLLHSLPPGGKGMAAICIGGGQGGAMLVEKL